MTLEIDWLAKSVLSANRKGLVGKKPVFKPHAETSSAELKDVEEGIGTPLPNDLRSWLLAVGYGDIDEELSFRKQWLARIESGQLKGDARFAQDILGNFYAFDSSGRIFFLSRSEPVFAEVSRSFLEFIGELVRRDYKLVDWMNTLETQLRVVAALQRTGQAREGVGRAVDRFVLRQRVLDARPALLPNPRRTRPPLIGSRER